MPNHSSRIWDFQQGCKLKQNKNGWHYTPFWLRSTHFWFIEILIFLFLINVFMLNCTLFPPCQIISSISFSNLPFPSIIVLKLTTLLQAQNVAMNSQYTDPQWAQWHQLTFIIYTNPEILNLWDMRPTIGYQGSVWWVAKSRSKIYCALKTHYF